MSGHDVVVVGGGLAGLSAAVACAERGSRVTLLERAPRLGGATWSFRRKGVWYDNGQHVFLRCCTYYRSFLERLGVSDRVSLQPRLDIPVFVPGRRPARLYRVGWPAPLHLLPSLARYTPLSIRERFAVARGALALGRLSPGDRTLDDRTFGSWLEEQGQPRAAIDALWNLIALPTLNLPADEASLALAVKVFRTGLLDTADASDIGYGAVPLSRLHAGPARRILENLGAIVRTTAHVDGIEFDDMGRTVRVGAERVRADAVIVAVPHRRAASLLAPLGVATAERFDRLGSSPILNLHVHYDRRVLETDFAAVVGSPVQWVFDRTKASGAGRGQLVSVSLSGAAEHIGESVDGLRARFLPELARLFPSAGTARVIDVVVTREHHATFRQAPGALALRPGPRTGIPGVYLAGAWTDTGWPATMEGAVRSGVTAAREALIHVGATRDLPAEVAA